MLVTAGQVGEDLKEAAGRLRVAPWGPVEVSPAAGAGVGPGPAAGAQGVAVGAARDRGLGDHRQADRALQQGQHAQGQLLERQLRESYQLSSESFSVSCYSHSCYLIGTVTCNSFYTVLVADSNSNNSCSE